MRRGAGGARVSVHERRRLSLLARSRASGGLLSTMLLLLCVLFVVCDVTCAWATDGAEPHVSAHPARNSTPAPPPRGLHLQLEPPHRVAARVPRPGDLPGNGSNQGILWFPHTISRLPSGVLFLRLAVHPDATMPFNHAAIFTSVDGGKTWQPQTLGCSNADVAACSLPTVASSGTSGRFGPTLSWEMAVAQASCKKLPEFHPDGDLVLVAGYQPHLLGDGTSIGWNGTQLLISSHGAVSVMERVAPVVVHGLPHPVLDLNYTSCLDCGQPVDPPRMKRRLAAANANHGEPIHLPNGDLLTLLISVTYEGVCLQKSCSHVVAIVSHTCGRSWEYLSTVTADGNEAAATRLLDGRLFAVWRHDFDSTILGQGVAYKQAFSANDGREWSQGTPMTAAQGSVVPHSVMPTVKPLPNGGALLSGGRGGLYIWHCSSPSCIDSGQWVSTNVAEQHNVLAKEDPFGPFPERCVNDSNWRQQNSCPSKEYLGLALLTSSYEHGNVGRPAAASGASAPDNADFVVCYGHCGKVSEPVMSNDTNGWCFTELGPGQEVYCARGSFAGAESRAMGSPLIGSETVALKLDDSAASLRVDSAASLRVDSESSRQIGKRIRWFMGNATTMAGSRFLAANSDLVDGFYLCCFAMYVNDDGQICPHKRGPCRVDRSSEFDWQGLNAMRTRNLSVHAAIASSIGPTQCQSVYANKESFAANLLKAAQSLPGMNASQHYQLQGFFLDWEFGTQNEMECWTPLWRYVAAVLHANGLQLGFDVDNSQYNLSHPNSSNYGYLWNFTQQVAYADFLTNMGTYPVGFHSTIQLRRQWNDPRTNLRPVRCGGVYEWCGLEGAIKAMQHVGARASDGQLEPAVWIDGEGGCNYTAGGYITNNGWTLASFRSFLAYLDDSGVRSLAVWTQPLIERGPPTANDTCTGWMLEALREWKHRP